MRSLPVDLGSAFVLLPRPFGLNVDMGGGFGPPTIPEGRRRSACLTGLAEESSGPSPAVRVPLAEQRRSSAWMPQPSSPCVCGSHLLLDPLSTVYT